METLTKLEPVEHTVGIFLRVTLVVLAVYYVLAYWVAPSLWRHYEHHPKLETAPKTTFTKEGIPGDPLNVGLVGNEADVIHSMTASGWLPADPITFRTSMRITESALFGKPYPTAPVSNLYVFGRVEDLAFEQSVPGNTRQRNHVRFWRSDELGRDGKPLWIGAATFDQSVGVSHLTGKITHHIAPDLDEERDKLIGDLLAHSQLVSQYQVTGVGGILWGRNGGGDKYFTDGELSIGVLTTGGAANTTGVLLPANPVMVQAKNGIWSTFRWLFRKGWQPHS
jgi:hypothetical protein